ncbi:histidine phosphotransferase family protein [Rickettsiales endosymbiont of Stachyamoeba lipophora]|uniref:histidine phosphotransferase family protein n=1 Tax=Rickettsiales endosymbiont of Stachyamoeba lipophora TaxID=2486578 RepID=UPI000F645C11|nr:histidine phosphotransferase family protein [Rickettsiales endosymbiont of Stachyamoeba lipophora]AZL15949.1 hypothetical protein EF513_05285 [Rickettsiales endosymbiont of Stachyamoeba lipophora]
MITDFEMGEILQSKFFHDMAGPVGAINNGVEFLGENRSEVQKKAIELMTISAQEAVTRMQYYKFAYGYLPINLEASIDKTIKVVTDYFYKNKIRFNWNGLETSNIKINNKVVKLLLNTIYIAAAAMIYGGEISVKLGFDKATNNLKFEVIGSSASGIKLDRDMISLLVENNTLPINSKNVQFFYFKRFAEIHKIKYATEINDKITFKGELLLDIKQAEIHHRHEYADLI